MNKTAIILLLAVCLFCCEYSSSETISANKLPNGAMYLSHKFIVVNKYDAPSYQINKSSSGYAATGVYSVDLLCCRLGVIKVEPFYQGKLNKPTLIREISRMYIFTLQDDKNPLEVIPEFINNPNIEMADLYSVPEPYYVPNDPYLDYQWHFQQTQTFEAWDIVRGDTTRHSIIGLIDTGVDWENDEITPNIWVNEPEDLNHNGILDPDDINNIDDDGNGLVDDVIGWDFGDNDNNPMEDFAIHGTGVACCASEATDNGILGAGMGFSARIMCVKASNYQGYLTHCYQSIIYAVDNGAQIINCSWGIPVFNGVEQAIINAAWAEDVLIIAAAGHNSDQESYPAAYENVVAVASTDEDDHRAPFSAYGTWIDICAPGVNIPVIWDDDYIIISGTSFSSAIVAGLAALVRAWYPDYSNDETQQLIEESADSIDYLNPVYEGLLGAGRINSYNCFSSTGIDNTLAKPEQFHLFQNHPNPFNPTTTIRYNLPEASCVRLDIYNILGQKVITIVNEKKQAGNHHVTWQADDYPSGIYFYKISTADFVNIKKMTLLK